jgi:MauM/NapG family ferredoxin protein
LYSQFVFFVLFCTVFFLCVAFPRAYSIDCRWLLRSNPLVGFLTFIASRKIIWGFAALTLAVTALTVVFGRFFCGFCCPLGATIDFADHFFFSRIAKRLPRPPHFLQKLKYLFLFGIGTVALFGVIFPIFFDPISLFARVLTVFVHPLPSLVIDQLKQIPILEGHLSGAGHIPLYYGSLGIGFLFFLVIAGGVFDRRFWCQYVCPSGAFFGLLSSFAPFRRRVHDARCSECSACAKRCPTRAIGEKDFRKTSTAECIMCGACTGTAKGCGSFGFADPGKTNSVIRRPDLSRRTVLAGVAGGAFLLPMLQASAMLRRDNTGRLIRPPGAAPDPLFSAKCLACGLCMKACPTNSIQPCSLDDGFARLSTPKIVPRIGSCEEKCHLCGAVCPTQAIRKLPYEEKQFAKIGTAVVDRHRCIAWEQNKECLVCAEVCPYHAIDPKSVATTKGQFMVPVVVEDLCMGCGQCEHECPVFDTAAIVVYKFGENRRENGFYASEAQKEDIIKRRNRSGSDSPDAGADATGAAAPGKGDAGAAEGKPSAGASPSNGFSF